MRIVWRIWEFRGPHFVICSESISSCMLIHSAKVLLYRIDFVYEHFHVAMARDDCEGKLTLFALKTWTLPSQ